MEGMLQNRFTQQVDAALQEIRTVLDNARNPALPADVQHTYADKYIMVEHVTNTAYAAVLNCLEELGLTGEALATAIEWVSTRSVSLCFSSEATCTFIKKATRTIEPTSERVHEYGSSTGFKAKFSSKTVTKVTEWFWKYEAKHKLEIYKGSSGSKDRIVLREGSGTCELVTTSENTPKPEKQVSDATTISLTKLLSCVNKDGVLAFAIDRSADSCHTPRRNADSETALRVCSDLRVFSAISSRLESYFSAQPHQEKIDRGVISRASLFNPVVPLFEEKAGEKKAAEKQFVQLPDDSAEESVVLPYQDTNKFLAHQKQTIAAKKSKLEKVLPAEGMITPASAMVVVLSSHIQDLARSLCDAINYVEDLIRKQVISAIGKVVTPVDFAEYMRFHYRKLFQDAFAPLPFSHAVRRPDHSPEGIISIESLAADGTVAEPVFTIFRRSEEAAPMQFPINAATNVTFGGDRYLHAYVAHQFSGSSGSALRLAARARQFSCFILMVGRIASAKVFEPTHAVIIQNKDDLLVPLLLEQIPTPKEFRDAIESLSPEQQRFAKAFRAMQLESTLFGVCVVQIKPQLEKLLRLPEDSLTKEIRLTQDLLELFIKYQIPSDLLSYDGEGPCSAAGKVKVVKDYVAAMYEMINEKKKTEIQEAKQTRAYNQPVMTMQEFPVQQQPRRDFMSAPPSSPCPPPCASAMMSPPPPGPPPAGGAPPPPPAAAPAAPPQQQQQQQQQHPQEQAQEQQQQYGSEEAGAEEAEGEDYTLVPAKLDRKFELLDEDAAVRPTIIKPATSWNKTFQKSLLSDPEKKHLGKEDLKKERDAAFDLLDALSKSGSLAVDHASLHVVMAATHCFDKTLLDTVVKDNVNPIEKVERSALILATTIHNLPAEQLVRPGHLEAAKAASPALFSA